MRLVSFILFLFFAAFGFAHISTAAGHTGNETDRLALLVFKSGIKQDPYGILNSWNESQHFCQWHGVTCGHLHQRVTALELGSSQLTGSISPFIGNLSFLRLLNLVNNSFSHAIPPQISNLRRIKHLRLSNNSLVGNIPRNLSACSNLLTFSVRRNKLDGVIPMELGSLIKLTVFDIGYNELTGGIPTSFGNMSSLVTLYLTSNKLTGSIPSTLGRLSNLVKFAMAGNMLSGTIPSDIFNLSNIAVFDVQDNQLEGVLPSYLGNTFTKLYFFGIDTNKFTGSIPVSFSNASEMIYILASHNYLTGEIPKFINSGKLLQLFLADNQLGSGGKYDDLSFFPSLTNCTDLDNIPPTLASCVLLEELYMEGNLFQGKIPSSLSALRGLQFLSLDSNNLSGPIPDFLGEFELHYLNLSFNDFEGELPNKGIFKNASAVFVDGNTRLCGGVPELKLPICISSRSKKKSRSATYKLIVFTILGVLGLTLILCLLLFCWFKRKRPQQSLESSDHVHFRASYQALRAATDRFSSANMIGSGGFGSVYRGNLEDGKLIAVKVLNLAHRGAAKSFIAECEALRNIRHRNLVKLLTVCSGIDYQGNDFKAVVYEFMVNGNLDEWLHLVPTEDTDQQRHNMNLLARLSIAIDVATALNYLHNDCQPPIVHCDIKPSNILLDNEMTAHVGDFGLARFIIKRDINDEIQTSTGGVRGSIGYTPPEYGLGSEMSTSGDVYSFGILLLEMMTGKRPTDSMFHEGHNLHHFAQMSLPDKVTDIVDNVLVQDNEECLISAVKIGVACSLESPKDRMRTSDVLRELNVLKALFLSRA